MKKTEERPVPWPLDNSECCSTTDLPIRKPKYPKFALPFTITPKWVVTSVGIALALYLTLSNIVQFFAVLVLSAIVVYFMLPYPTYIIDIFPAFFPEPNYKVTEEKFVRLSKRASCFGEDALNFQERLLYAAKVGPNTAFPIPESEIPEGHPPTYNMFHSRRELKLVLTRSMDYLFKETKLYPQDIDILVCNCSLFCPTPSIAATIMNHYKMRNDILSYNIGGMGCSASLISLDLVSELFQNHRNRYAIIFATENITENWYRGQNRSMLLSNTLFRMGGVAILLTNKNAFLTRNPRLKPSYKLKALTRVTTSSDDPSFCSVVQREDIDGIRGVSLSRDLTKNVIKTLQINFSRIGPKILPLSEQIRYIIKLMKTKKGDKPPSPDFKKAFEHICIHAGGRGVIDGLQTE